VLDTARSRRLVPAEIPGFRACQKYQAGVNARLIVRRAGAALTNFSLLKIAETLRA
jgi:hypothetical protein